MDHHLVRSSQIGTGQLAGGRWHVFGGLGEEGVFSTLLRAAGCSITFRVSTRLPALSSKLRDRRIVSNQLGNRGTTSLMFLTASPGCRCRFGYEL